MQPFNKYYPPDYDGKSNINKMAGTHALGRRARKLNQGILIVRFEMPFNIWCGSCNQHIGQGVRFNAEKKKVGSFHTTPIWSFRMKCHLCSAWFEIRTDPENTRYMIADGAKRQTDEWDTTDQGVVQPKSMSFYAQPLTISGVEEQKALEDPFAKLEKDEEDKVKASEQHQIISKLYDLSDRQWADPWKVNSSLRKEFRQDRKVRKAKSILAEEIRTRNGLHIDLLPESEDDAIRAKMIEFQGNGLKEAEIRKRELKTGSFVLGKRERTVETKKKELERVVKLSTRERADPFLHRLADSNGIDSLRNGVKVVKKKEVERNGPKALAGFADGYSSESE
jgi:coiled-coil domain-containing protein 130